MALAMSASSDCNGDEWGFKGADGRHPQGVDRHACDDQVSANSLFPRTVFDYSNYLIF
ncbi:hypothetical protein A2U01_0066424 [Trifolium medium]|uniref:Uncharacterized protein n=1 Tax=Trifolium medium TaxID=97028 RepID=A0A392SBC7_9FABA|nr:hypothetical protein [Trifolium medium]